MCRVPSLGTSPYLQEYISGNKSRAHRNFKNYEIIGNLNRSGILLSQKLSIGDPMLTMAHVVELLLYIFQSFFLWQGTFSYQRTIQTIKVSKWWHENYWLPVIISETGASCSWIWVEAEKDAKKRGARSAPDSSWMTLPLYPLRSEESGASPPKA